MQTEKITDDMIRELCILTTRDDAGRHFTQWARHWQALEQLGLIEIYRPRHEATGIQFDQEYWSAQLTDAGLDMVKAHPESAIVIE